MKIPHTLKLCGASILVACAFMASVLFRFEPEVSAALAACWSLICFVLVGILTWRTFRRFVREFAAMWRKL